MVTECALHVNEFVMQVFTQDQQNFIQNARSSHFLSFTWKNSVKLADIEFLNRTHAQVVLWQCVRESVIEAVGWMMEYFWISVDKNEEDGMKCFLNEQER